MLYRSKLKEMTISPEQIAKANSTSRGWKETAVSKAVRSHISFDDAILDFGSGKLANQARILKEEGYNVTAYDFGSNVNDDIHDRDALKKKYDVIYASNVLNVQSSPLMMETTLKQITNSMKPNGKFIANYTLTPRYMEMDAEGLIETFLSDYFSDIKRIGGGKKDPIWLMKK